MYQCKLLPRPCLLNMPAVLQMSLLKIFRCAVGVHLVSMYNFTTFRCAENHTSQDHFRCVMVCYCARTPQKTKPDFHHVYSTFQKSVDKFEIVHKTLPQCWFGVQGFLIIWDYHSPAKKIVQMLVTICSGVRSLNMSSSSLTLAFLMACNKASTMSIGLSL